MDKVKILIVEDEPIIALDLERSLKKMNYNVINVVESGEEAMSAIEEDLPDLILMDIQLEGHLDGIDTAHQISKLFPIPIIYLTSNTDERTFSRAKLTQPHGFLSKPFRLQDVVHSIDLAFIDTENSSAAAEKNEQDTITTQLEDCIFVKAKEYLVKINLADILYVEADSCYCNIVTAEKKHVIVSTLKKFESALSYANLTRVHRSFIINIKAIEKIGDSYLVINDKMISIGRSYREQFFQRIPKF